MRTKTPPPASTATARRANLLKGRHQGPRHGKSWRLRNETADPVLQQHAVEVYQQGKLAVAQA
jgi:hypothetical protein